VLGAHHVEVSREHHLGAARPPSNRAHERVAHPLQRHTPREPFLESIA
jgi:hypothetical protein